MVVLDASTIKGTNVVLDGTNLNVKMSIINSSIKADKGVSKGKFYWEVYTNGDTCLVGIVGSNYNSVVITTSILGYYGYNGYKWRNGSGSAYGANFTGSNNTIGFALDMESKTLEFFKNGVSQGVAFTGLTDTIYYPCLANGSNTNIEMTINFGLSPFKYNIPNGFQPYDNPRSFLIQQGVNVYSIDHNYIKLGEPTSDMQLNNWFELYGYDDIKILLEDSTRRTVSSQKDIEVYETRIVDFKQFLGNIDIKEINETSDNVSYDSTPYKLLDDIKKIDNGKFNVLVKK